MDDRGQAAQEGELMGRNARKRAIAHEAAHPHGVKPPEEAQGTRCPRCGSTNVFIGRTHPFQRYLDVICGNCNWQGEIPTVTW